ncbi:MAG: N-acetylmuramoyl-L-alanine amidase [Gemmatimonadetes bacterium]|nr:N-acetylmuramoyl-L-alanine amidase [Gemmatimonadota bacterium]
MKPIALAGLVLAALAWPASAHSQSLRVHGLPGTDALDPVSTAEGTRYAAAALARFDAVLEPSPDGLRVSLLGDVLTFRVGSPFFTVGSDIVQLTDPVRRLDGDVLLPLQFFAEWLPARWPDRFALRAGALHVSLPAAQPARPAARPLVVLDAGHGGRDNGKIGPNGLREKAAALQLTRRIADSLAQRGFSVQLTRTADTLISLDDRPRLANRWKGAATPAVFLSIHMNSTTSSSARGFETFFLSEARTEDERRVAEMENAAAALEDGPSRTASIEDVIMTGLRNDFYVRASNDLAEAVQRAIARVHDGPDRGVKRAGFRVLVGALMPAVLVEAGFISNPQEARRLADASFQAGLAGAIAQAVETFFRTHAHLWAGT